MRLRVPAMPRSKLFPALAVVSALFSGLFVENALAEGNIPAPGAVATNHWAFQPVRLPKLPTVQDVRWPTTPVDHFILAALESRGWKPAPAADRHTLIRRVTIDLTGLPPTPEEVDDFVRDTRPDAYERLVERLLASPAYGERWARHWLDVARYADSKGYVFREERRYPFAYTYRDYVIRAFHQDLPYDRFIVEQLAADRIPDADKPSLAAMGFLTLGRRFLNNIHDIIDDRIDVTMRGLLGLTVGCARCHDHKYDPIPMTDYYSLYGVFASSVEPNELPQIGETVMGPLAEEFQRTLAKLKADLERFEKEHENELKAGNQKFREQRTALKGKIDAHLASHPGSPPRAMVLNDKPEPVQPRVFLRGNPNNPGEQVPRQFLYVIAGDQRRPFREGSGRLELAKAIASPENPLTARVFVNRVWAWHFGKGLVDSLSDFGIRTPPPSHPELLDYLAARFMADGWSVKKLHRLIVLSSTYRQASTVTPGTPAATGQVDAIAASDPENRLLARMNRRRLDYETMRDSLLFVAGRLDRTMGGPAVDADRNPKASRRTIYNFIDRQNLPGVLRAFDFASPDTHCPQRFVTTVPQQALYLMNHPFVEEQAKALAQRASGTTPQRRIETLYRIALGRLPKPEETTLALDYIQNEPDNKGWERFAQVLLASNEFMFID